MIAKLHAAKDKYLSPPAPVSPSSQMEVSTFSLNLWPFDFELEWPVLRALNYSSHFLIGSAIVPGTGETVEFLFYICLELYSVAYASELLH